MNKHLLCTMVLALTTTFTPAIAQEMRTVTDDTGTEVSIPVKPLRIVSLHDTQLTIPLIKLGIMPVGSHGRGDTVENAFIRASAAITGVDFGNSDIEWVGNYPADIEMIAAMNPDLILTTAWQPADLDQLRVIAPTVQLNGSIHSEWEIYAMLADLTGTTDKLAVMIKRYQAQIEMIRNVIDTESIMISTIHANENSFFAYNPYGNIGKVLVDAGFQRPAATDMIPINDSIDVSAEALVDFDADFIMTSYRSSAQQYPDDVRAFFEGHFPGYCDILHACREDQMIFLSRAEASSTSYYALGAVAYAILTAIGGREFTPMPR